ncbi:MAG TPA: hypothetical protein VEL07_15635 [Planctomycetota bacterium]|nr:hypothetical protein [Planctomycetota bacterium]
MSAEDVRKTDTFIRRAEAKIAALHEKGVDTKSLRACVELARCWAVEGSRNHAEAICDEVMSVAGQIEDEPSRIVPATPAAPEHSPTGTRIHEVENRLRDHFSRELGQALAAKPWNRERRTEDGGPGMGVRDTLEQVRAQVEELRRLMQEGGAAGVSLDEVKSVLAGELEANGLASKLNRIAMKAGTEPAVPPFVQRLDARLMQIAHAQDRVAERLMGLERSLGRLVEQSIHERLPPDSGPIPAAVPQARETTGSWLQDLDAEAAPVAASAHPPETISASPAPVALDPPCALDVKDVKDEKAQDAQRAQPAPHEADATEAPTLVVTNPASGENYSTASPARTTGPLQRVDDEQLRAVMASQMALHQPPTASVAMQSPEQSDAEFIKRLARVLPEVLRLPGVHESVLALVAVEAATHPGALAELSGVRAFLRRELLRQVDDIKKALVIGEPV